jgi:hypothetical protein
MSSTMLAASAQIMKRMNPPKPPIPTSTVSSLLSNTEPRLSTMRTAVRPESHPSHRGSAWVLRIAPVAPISIAMPAGTATTPTQ